MPYQKSGRLNDISKGKRILVIAMSVLLVFIGALAIVYAAAPRNFLKFFLGKTTYAETVLYKNITEDLPTVRDTVQNATKKQAWHSEGTVNIQPSDSVQDQLGSKLAAEQFQEYVNSMTFKNDTQLNRGRFQTTTALSDGDGSLFTVGAVSAGTGLYAEVEELQTGWIRLSSKAASSSSGRDTRMQELLSSNDKAVRDGLYGGLKDGYKAVKKDILVKEDKNLTVGVDTKQASGDRSTIILDKANAVTFVKAAFTGMAKDKSLYRAANRILGDEDAFSSMDSYQSYLSEQEQRLLTAIEKTGVSKVSVDLYVTSRNKINAFDVLVKRGAGDLVLRGVLTDDSGRGCAFVAKSGQNTIFDMDLTKASSDSGTIDLQIHSAKKRITYDNYSRTGSGIIYGTFSLEPSVFDGHEDLGTVDAILTLQESPTKSSAVSAGLQFDSSTLGRTLISATLSKEKAVGVKAPAAGEIGTAKPSEAAASLLNYMMTDVRSTHPSFKRLVNRVAMAYVNSYFSSVVADPTS